MSTPVQFPDDVVAAIASHLNDDHHDDVLEICRRLVPAPDIDEAAVTDLDGHVLRFTATAGGEQRTVEVRWDQPVTTRSEVRAAVMALAERARGSQPGPPHRPSS